jgi:hypothetical protein
MALACPICKSPAQEIARTADATRFHCPTHGDFKVADNVFAEDGAPRTTPAKNGKLRWTRPSNERSLMRGL